MSKLSEALRKAFHAYAEINPSEDKEALYEVKLKLSDLTMQIRELEDENQDLREQVRELENQLKAVKRLEYKDGAYFTWDDTGKRIGLICYECYMKSGAIYPLQQRSDGAHCSVCKSHYAGVTFCNN